RVLRWAKESRTSKTALGVNYERFGSSADKSYVQGKNLLESISRPIAVYIGGLEPIYQIKSLLDAASDLEDWTVVIAGAGSLEPLVVTYANERKNIRFLGEVSHEKIPGMLQAADVGVSLVDDPHTLKILEYGAAGLPTVQLDGQAHERFGDYLTYTNGDPEDVATAIKRAYTRGFDERHREFAQRHDWSKIADDYVTAIEIVR
ncbi:MAG: glycosyltransferase, partial [Halobacteriaceae archaeon]